MNRSREYARILMQKAREDEWVLKRLIDAPEAPGCGIAFHAQQAVEKATKAVLASRSIEYPHTHNLARILDMLDEGGLGLPPDAAELPCLTPFGAVLRYDDPLTAEGAAPVPDRPWMRDCVSRTLAWAESLLVEGGK